MKGVSAVIATILMLMITIALAGLAYMYISGIFISRTATAISISSVDCTNNNIYLMIKNDGTSGVPQYDVDVSVDGGTIVNCTNSATLIPAGQVAACTAIATTAGTRTLRVIGPSNALTGSVYCA